MKEFEITLLSYGIKQQLRNKGKQAGPLVTLRFNFGRF